MMPGPWPPPHPAEAPESITPTVAPLSDTAEQVDGTQQGTGFWRRVISTPEPEAAESLETSGPTPVGFFTNRSIGA